MKWVNQCLLILLFFCPAAGLANTGVFFGSGSQVIPIKNKMFSSLKSLGHQTAVDEEAGKWGTPFFPRADVEAEFIEKYIESKLTFRLVSHFLTCKVSEQLVLSKLDFRAKGTDTERKVTLKEGLIEQEFDPKGLFKKVFSWEELFQPNQIKKVIVCYRSLMGIASAIGAATMVLTENIMKRMFPALAYSFGYITKAVTHGKNPSKVLFLLLTRTVPEA